MKQISLNWQLSKTFYDERKACYLMNKYLKFTTLMAVMPLLAVGVISAYTTDVHATKSEGTGLPRYGSDTGVCGIQLCSEIPGGKAAWMANLTGMIHNMQDESDEDMQKDDSSTEMDSNAVLRLSRTNVPATIPLHHGYYNGGDVFFIITDSSDPTHAKIISESQGWNVELAPVLASTPESALSKTYFFTNGIEGKGVHGYQGEVFTSTPAQPDTYSALTSHIHVTWNVDFSPRMLDSEEMILVAEENGEVFLTPLEVVLNMPHIVWPEGQMIIKEDTAITDDTPYGGGQITDIDIEEMTVTFIAHRGWGPDGRTIYYIVTDATPSGPAEMMGVVSSPTSANTLVSPAAVDLFQFKNGLVGSGPLGFQPGIATGAPGDDNYSPLWRIFLIEWNDADDAKLLETVDDINAYRESGAISINIAKPMDSDHIVNCPFIDPFQ